MSLYGAEFIQNINEHLGIFKEPPIDVQFHPYGYLTLASEECAKTLQDNSRVQNFLGARNVILSAKEIKSRFPWISTDGIELGCLGLEKEGWFDPWLLLNAFRQKGLSMGVDYVAAEAIGFHFELKTDVFIAGCDGPFEDLEYLVVNLFYVL